MASVFLSYAREDAAKAKALATALERAGHGVWWDRHIRSGSEFAGAIEEALKRADAVLVLWSEKSVCSSWVRDEAAEGRDSGRLVAAVLDSSRPPIGFRQFQSTDLSSWSGRGTPKQFDELLGAIAEKRPARQGPEEPQARAPAKDSIFASRRLGLPGAVVVGLAALVLFFGAIGAWWSLSKPSEVSAPVLAVLPFSDLSPQRDKAYFAEGVAEAILTVLAKEPGIRVIGRSTAQQLHSAGADGEKMRRALGVTHVLEGSARSAGDQLRMSVRLINAVDGRQLWAEEYQRRLDNVFAVQDEIGRAVAQRLKGSFSSGAKPAAQLTNADVYTLYLAARAKMRDRRLSSLQDAMKIARQVIATDPKYAPGHALYAELLYLMSFDNYGNIPPDRARQLARPHAREAIRLAPDSPEGYAALGMISVGADALEPLRTAIRLSPARAELRLWLAQAYTALGRQQEALEQIIAATEIDPLSTPVLLNHAHMLAASGRRDEAEAVVSSFERRGGSPAVAAKIRGEIASFHGDYSEGIRLVRAALATDPETPLGMQSLAWMYRMLGFSDEAAKVAKGLPTYTRLLVADDFQGLRSEALQDAAKAWQQPDPDAAAEALAILRDWAGLEQLHDAGAQGLQSVCTDPRFGALQQGIHLATALGARNRRDDADRYLRCLKSSLTTQERGPLRSPYLGEGGIALIWAEVHALEGEPGRAFERLDRAVDRGVRTRFGAGLGDYPAFDRYRGSPQYAAMDARLKQLIARERAEVLRSG
ncbi:MAG: TIR domain-containing protein [Sphingomonas sp.]|nr:TIR domain-containing protein [Sphingomonas sp.]